MYLGTTYLRYASDTADRVLQLLKAVTNHSSQLTVSCRARTVPVLVYLNGSLVWLAWPGIDDHLH